MAGVQDHLSNTPDFYREIVESVNSIILSWDTDCRLTFINQFALRFFGYTREEVLGKCLIGTIVPKVSSSGQDLTRMLRDIQKYPGRYMMNENENLRKNGELVWISWTNKPILDASGNVTGILAVGNDITAIKKAEEELKKARAEVEARVEERTAELRQSEERYRAFFENSIDAVLITAPDGSIESANPEACRMFRMSEDEIIRTGRDQIVDPSDQRLRQLIEAREKTGKAMGELNYRRKDGTIFPGEMSSAVYRDRYGHVKTAIMIRDITERKRAQESLEKYRLISENARDIVLFLRRDGQILEANRAAVNAYGYSREELLSMSVYGLRAVDPGYQVDEQIDTAFDRGLLFEALHLRKDGTIFPVEVSSQGELVGGQRVLVSVIRDITERKQAENTLKAERNKLQTLIDTIPVGVAVAEVPDGRITYSSPALNQIFLGTISGTAYGPNTDAYRLLNPDGTALPGYKLPLSISIRTGKSVSNAEILVRRQDGSEVITLCNSSAIKDSSGKITGAIATILDITERKQADQERERLLDELAAQRGRLEAIMDSLPVGVFIADSAGRFLKINALVDEIWGGSRKAPLSEHILEYGEYKGWFADTGKQISPEEWALSRALREGKVTIGEVIDIERFDGTRGTIINNAAPVRDKNGNIIGGVVIVQDITSRRLMERELSDAKEQAELYVDLMGHDINNMNQSAMGYLELALDQLEVKKNLGREDKTLIEMPLKALDNSSRLIDNVRKLQQLMKEGVKTKPVDMCALLREIDVKSFDLQGRDVSVNTMLGQQCLVEANELLKDVFINLISNAIKHSGKETPLVIGVHVDAVSENGKDYYRCIVEDNGPGIPDSLKDKLFYRFQRGDTRAHGKGLGLYLVRTLIEGYHGKVWVEDRVPGDHTKGAKFVVLVPAIM